MFLYFFFLFRFYTEKVLSVWVRDQAFFWPTSKYKGGRV